MSLHIKRHKSILRSDSVTTDHRRRGAALIAVSVVITTLMVLTMSMLQISLRSSNSQQGAGRDADALYLAETGLNEAMASLLMNSSGALGSRANPVRFGDGVFWVDLTPLDDSNVVLTSTALLGSGRASVQSQVESTRRGGVRYPMVSNKKLDLKSGTFVDSYDSDLGDYAGQAVNTLGGVTYAGANADVVSNGEVRLHKDINVFGSVAAGPNSVIVMKDDISTMHIEGNIGNLEQPMTLPSVVMPSTVPLEGKIHEHGANTGSFDLIYNGPQHHFEEFKVHKDAYVKFVGPAWITIDEKLEFDAKVVIDDTLGPVVFFVGKEVKTKEDTSITTTSGSPDGLFIVMAHEAEYDGDGKLKKTKHKVKIEGEFHGIIYAPDAKVELKKEADVFGSIMADEIKLKNGARFHYDEALGRSDQPYGGKDVTVRKVTWRVVALPDQDLRSDRSDAFEVLGVAQQDLLHPHESWVAQPPNWTSQYSAWGPGSPIWDESIDQLYDDPIDNVLEDDAAAYLIDNAVQ